MSQGAAVVRRQSVVLDPGPAGVPSGRGGDAHQDEAELVHVAESVAVKANDQAHVDSLRRAALARNRAAREAVESKRSFDSSQHSAVSTQQAAGARKKASFCQAPPFIEIVQERIARDWLRGVSERALSSMYRVTRDAIEQTVRVQVQAMLRGARPLVRASVACACLLIGVSVLDVWLCGRGDVTVVERAFARNGRARKRGLEDGSGLIELAVVQGVAA